MSASKVLLCGIGCDRSALRIMTIKKRGKASATKKAEGTNQPLSSSLGLYVTTKQAAELLGVADAQIRHLLLVKRIGGIKPGHDWLVFRPSLEAYFRTKPKKGKPPSHVPKLAKGTD